VRTIPALLVTVGLVASLTACASGTASASGCDTPSAGSASESVTASGKLGSKPTVDVPAKLTTDRTQVSVLTQGTGRVLTDGSPAVIEYTVVDGATGKTVQTSGYKGSTSPVTVGSKNAGALGQALECARVGDRLSIVMTKKALQGGAATTKTQQSAAVVIADVVDGFPSRATGTPQLAADHMPAVVLAPNGAPGITVPSSAAPKTDQYHLLRRGGGQTITSKDTAVVKYTAVTWGSDDADSSVAGSSWTDGSGAVTVPLAKGGQIQAGIRNALVGRRVGDQVLAIVSQSGTTYAYVFDLLGVMPR
jgi:peptidylprolyl isomerase